MGKNYAHYTDSTKKNVVAAVRSGLSIRGIGKRLSIPLSTISQWVHVQGIQMLPLHRKLKTNGKNYVLKYIILRIPSFLFKRDILIQSNSKGGELTQ